MPKALLAATWLVELERINRSAQAVANFNIAAIREIASQPGVSASFVRQSDLPYDGVGAALLISLVKSVGGRAYLAGGGAAEYQEDDLCAQDGG